VVLCFETHTEIKKTLTPQGWILESLKNFPCTYSTAKFVLETLCVYDLSKMGRWPARVQESAADSVIRV